MTVTVTHRLDEAALDQLLRSRTGPVGVEMFRRGKRVEAAAKRLCPVDTGRLRSSIGTTVEATAVGPVAVVGTDVEYAIFRHEGTGVFGPRGAVITPKRGRFLVFTPRGAPGPVFARSVRGSPGVPFLRDALRAARG